MIRVIRKQLHFRASYVYSGSSIFFLNLLNNICSCVVWSLIEANFFGSIKGNEECGYAHALINDYIVQGADKKNCSVGEEYSNMCKDVVMERELM